MRVRIMVRRWAIRGRRLAVTAALLISVGTTLAPLAASGASRVRLAQHTARANGVIPPPIHAKVPPAQPKVPPAPTNVQALAYAGGRVAVIWRAGRGNESDHFHLETYLVAGAILKDDGGTSAEGGDTVIGGLTVGSSYRFAVRAVNSAGMGPTTTTPTITAVGMHVPNAPTDLHLTTDGTDNQLTVSWTPSFVAPAAERYTISVFEGSGSALHQVGYVNCDAPCNTETIQAEPASITSVNVIARNSVGNSSYAWSNQVHVPQPCPLACVTVDVTRPGNVFNRTSDGFLDVAGPADAGSLAPQQWRTNALSLTTMSPAQVSDMKTAAVTELLSDDWLQANNVGGYAVLPWANWTAYSTWVKSEVTTVETLAATKGIHISYWDVQNEPFGGGYYSSSSQPPASETVSTFETQFLTAYRAIKAADPSAQVIGPSMIAFAASPADASGGIDLRSFLDFCAANDIQLGAVAFHDNNFTGSSGWFEPDAAPAAQPAEVQGHVAALRQFLAQRPSLGHPAIFVNEYGDMYTSELPGWDVGRIAALDGSGVDGANRSCWTNCDASLDGLLTNDGVSTLPGYWVYSYYSAMTGRTVPVTSSYTDVSGIASVSATGTVNALIGRHQSCLRLSSSYCPSYPSEAATVSLRVAGASAVQITTAVIPMGSSLTAPLTSLTTRTTTYQVVNGMVTFDTPALNDGDAVEITLTPAV